MSVTENELPPDESTRPRKRTRHSIKSQPHKEHRLFAPFRALGLVTNHIPCIVQTRSYKGASDGPRVHILSCLGKSWALWEGGKMTLLFVGPEVDAPISCLAMDGDNIWAASGPNVYKYFRGKQILQITSPLEHPVGFITIFGAYILALTDDGTRLFGWDTKSGQLGLNINFESGFTATSIFHPATYVNKIVVASAEGATQLWNIHSKTCIYKFQSSKMMSQRSVSVSDASVTAITQSPAVDVVGIGFRSGDIAIYDIRADEAIMKLCMEGGGVTCLHFRSDGEAVLASASSYGHIALWDLNSGGRLLHLVRGAHDGAITSLEWIPGQPVLISAGEDNSIKQWLFDSPADPPRLLKHRSGHQAPPHLIRFYGEDGKQLLTASRDRSFRCTSLVRDSRSFELSQGSLMKKASSLSIPVSSLKLPSVTALSYSSARAKEWDDILTAHTEDPYARTWHYPNKRVGQHTFGFEAVGKGKARRVGSVKAVCVTACGNYGLAGTSTGLIYMWNMQSGIKRRAFNIGPAPEGTPNINSSVRTVTGLVTDPLNRVVIVGTLDGTLNFFDFHTAKLECTLVIPSVITAIQLQPHSGLLAAICDDMTVRIVDIETRRVVRELGGFGGRVLDLAFSPDSRWLITTSLDSIIRTFDLATSGMIDAFRTPSIATSIAFSPTGDFLASSHVDTVGIYLWANRAQYATVPLQTINEDDTAENALPVMQSVATEDEELEDLSPLDVTRDSPNVFSTPSQLDGELVTLTLLPRSRWQTLINLEVIQRRNKPKEPPKAPEQAPFFLPTLPGVEQRFVKEDKQDDQPESKTNRRLHKEGTNATSVFYQKLVDEPSDGDYETFFAFLKTLTPAAIDLELRSLVGLDDLELFMHALTGRLKSHRDFEAVQAFLKVFLSAHGETLVKNEELLGVLQTLLRVQTQETARIVELTASSLGTLGFVRDVL